MKSPLSKSIAIGAFVSLVLANFSTAAEELPAPQLKSVQASVLVMDAGKVIGVIHVGVTTE